MKYVIGIAGICLALGAVDNLWLTSMGVAMALCMISIDEVTE